MIDKMFSEFGDDPRFRAMINNFVNDQILEISNDLKFKNLKLGDDIVTVTLMMVISQKNGFEFLRTINMVINGNDEVAFGNVNEFINFLENMFDDAQVLKEKHNESKTFGGD